LAEPVGTAWLNALRMTIVPLVTSLLIVGIATTAEAANASRLAGRSLAIFIICIWTSAALAALLTPLFLQILPLPVESAGALRAALSQATQPTTEVPGIADFLGSMIPTNPIAAAANDAILPLIVFTTVFAFALLRLPREPREQLTGFFRAVADVMLVIIGWVLWLAPIGVFALAFVVGARAGGAAFGALLHYIVIVSAVGIVIWMLAYPLAVFGGRVPLGRFARAVAPSQAVAISTQSSLASLPAMLRSSEAVGVAPATAGVVLPLAVAIFRATGPGMNVAVVLYVAHWYGMELGPLQIAAGIAAAAITTLGAVSLPGQVSFVTSIAPICLAMGIPIEPLAILIAVETIPDIFRTVGNVTMDVAVTATVSERSGTSADAPDSIR
jgi:Na+/H+-dicarboxylate symporter